MARRQWVNKLFTQARRNADKRDIEFNLTVEEMFLLADKTEGHCSLTGIPFSFDSRKDWFRNPWGPSLDRIDSAKPYSKKNCRFVCAAVNLAMNEWGEEVLSKVSFAYLARLNEVEEKKAQRKKEAREEYEAAYRDTFRDRIVAESGCHLQFNIDSSILRTARMAGQGPPFEYVYMNGGTVVKGRLYNLGAVQDWLDDKGIQYNISVIYPVELTDRGTVTKGEVEKLNLRIRELVKENLALKTHTETLSKKATSSFKYATQLNDIRRVLANDT